MDPKNLLDLKQITTIHVCVCPFADVTLVQCVRQQPFELLQVDALHDEDLVLLLEQVHVVQDHHASGVCALQLHRHRDLEEKTKTMDLETSFVSAGK